MNNMKNMRGITHSTHGRMREKRQESVLLFFFLRHHREYHQWRVHLSITLHPGPWFALYGLYTLLPNIRWICPNELKYEQNKSFFFFFGKVS